MVFNVLWIIFDGKLNAVSRAVQRLQRERRFLLFAAFIFDVLFFDRGHLEGFLDGASVLCHDQKLRRTVSRHLCLWFADMLQRGEINSKGIIRNLPKGIVITFLAAKNLARVEHEELVFIKRRYFLEKLRRQDLVPDPSRHRKDRMQGFV